MAECYIFAKYLEEEGCLAACFDEQDALTIKQRTFSELQTLCEKADCIIVIPSKEVSIYLLPLPWLPDKKARLAIPYALEEKLAENVGDLHFAFDKRYYEKGEYLVAVCNKNYLIELIKKLKEKHLTANSITVDWFALEPEETMLIDGQALIRNAEFSGTLAKEFISFYDFQKQSNQIYCFDSTFEQALHSEEFPSFVAKRLKKRPLFNLCQGELQQTSQTFSTKRLFQIAGGLACIWLLIFILFNLFSLHQINQQTAVADAAIEKVYKQFFPNAAQVISPRFRIESALKAQKNNNSQLWELLNSLAIAITNKTSIESIKYQNGRMQVTLKTLNFNALESLQLTLQKEQISVKQNQASTKNNQVVATLELQL